MGLSPFGISEVGENLPNGNGLYIELPDAQNNNIISYSIDQNLNNKPKIDDGTNFRNVDFSKFIKKSPKIYGVNIEKKKIKRNINDIADRYADAPKKVFKDQSYNPIFLDKLQTKRNLRKDNDNNKENITVIQSSSRQPDTNNTDLIESNPNFKLLGIDTDVPFPNLDVTIDDSQALAGDSLKLGDSSYISKAEKQSKKTKTYKQIERLPTRRNPPRKAKNRTPIILGVNDGTTVDINMSIYDYNYHSGDGGNNSNVSKYLTSKGHHSNSDDSYHNNDTSSRQQLYDIASSMASLSNIGNSCYMNSVIYTLRFTPLFVHNLHHLVNDFSQIINKNESQIKLKSSSLGRNVSGLQGQNARSWSSKDLVSLSSSSSSSSTPAFDVIKTTKQIAIEKLHELFQNLSSNETTDNLEPYHSDLFLKAIQDVNPIFEGNQQQDAHEFLMCILDSIRETCQVLTKTVTEHPSLIANGYVNSADQIEQPIIKPLTPPQQTSEKKSGSIWFRKKKDDKNKNPRLDSPSKDSENIDSGSGFTSTSNTVANNGSNGELSVADKQIVQDKIKALGLDFFSQEFEGVTASSTVCLSCEATTEQKETMIDLSVPITDNLDGLEVNNSFIQKLCITREQFHGDNKFRCEQCMGYTEAIRTISYPQLPRLLIIQLKRFSGGMEKISSYIPTPLTLQCFCASCCQKNEQSKEHEYKLYSVITHVGATMCAGHYIAYTCSLNLNNTYVNCPKDLKKKEAQATAAAAAAAASASAPMPSSTSTQKSSLNSSHIVSGVVKKIPFINRSKASSSHDVTKNLKNINGVKGILNGSEKLSSSNNTPSTTPTNTNSICPSLTCCSIKMKLPSFNTNTNNNTSSNLSNGIDYREHSRNSSLSSAYGEQFFLPNTGASSCASNSSTTNSKTNTEPIWYMCDDDKIKAMSQHEFVEALSPNKKNMITPYLLFYARNDVFLPPQ